MCALPALLPPWGNWASVLKEKAVKQERNPQNNLPTVKAASLPLHKHFAYTLELGTILCLRGGDLAGPSLPPISQVSRWGLLGIGLQGSLVSILAHLRSNSLLTIDLLHDTWEKHFILETAVTLCVNQSAHVLKAMLPKEEEKYPISPARAQTASMQKPLGNSPSP